MILIGFAVASRERPPLLGKDHCNPLIIQITHHGRIRIAPGVSCDGLEAVESGDAILKLISPLRPGLIEAGDQSGFQYLLMPIRLNV